MERKYINKILLDFPYNLQISNTISIKSPGVVMVTSTDLTVNSKVNFSEGE